MLGLAVTPIIFGKRIFCGVEEIYKHYWLPIADPMQWSCMPICWRSPTHIEVAFGLKINARPFKELALMASTGKKDILLQANARHDFW